MKLVKPKRLPRLLPKLKLRLLRNGKLLTKSMRNSTLRLKSTIRLRKSLKLNSRLLLRLTRLSRRNSTPFTPNGLLLLMPLTRLPLRPESLSTRLLSITGTSLSLKKELNLLNTPPCSPNNSNSKRRLRSPLKR